VLAFGVSLQPTTAVPRKPNMLANKKTFFIFTYHPNNAFEFEGN
jgi:hypothetical protein